VGGFRKTVSLAMVSQVQVKAKDKKEQLNWSLKVAAAGK